MDTYAFGLYTSRLRVRGGFTVIGTYACTRQPAAFAAAQRTLERDPTLTDDATTGRVVPAASLSPPPTPAPPPILALFRRPAPPAPPPAPRPPAPWFRANRAETCVPVEMAERASARRVPLRAPHRRRARARHQVLVGGLLRGAAARPRWRRGGAAERAGGRRRHAPTASLCLSRAAARASVWLCHVPERSARAAGICTGLCDLKCFSMKWAFQGKHTGTPTPSPISLSLTPTQVCRRCRARRTVCLEFELSLADHRMQAAMHVEG